MNPYAEKLKAYLREQPVDAVYNDAASLLDLLSYIYLMETPIDSATIRFQYQQLNCLVERLTVQENDQVFHLTIDLCDAYIRRAFQDGIRIGYHLMAELADLP